MGTFSQDEKRVSKLVEIIDTLDVSEEDAEDRELEIALLRRYMAKLSRHSRTELASSERSLLAMDAEDYQRIVHSK
jgi:hypothetical protein